MSPRLPQCSARQVIATLKKAGFEESHQKGSHCYLYQDVGKRTTTVPIHPGDIKRPLLKKILKQAGLTEDAFRELL